MNNFLATGTRRNAMDVYNEMENTIFSEKDRRNAKQKANLESCRRVYDACCNFLESHRLVNANVDLQKAQVIGCEAFNADASLAHIGETDLRQLCMDCGVPADKMDTAMKSVAVLLAKVKACAGNNELFRNQHFTHGSREGIDAAKISSNVNTFFAPSLYNTVSNIGLPSQEAFGANIDKVLPDIRASMAVTLLQFHRGLLDRIMHRRTSASPYIKYVVPYAEVYDMLLSNDPDGNVRNEGDHINPFINLYGDPRMVSNILQPIVPLVSNDTEGVLVADGFVKFNCRCNLFDLSAIPNSLGKSHYNYTDLVSENVILDSVLVELSDGTTTEIFQIPTAQVNGARLQMMTNTVDSGIRAAMLKYVVKFDKNTKTMTGATSTLLAGCTDTDYIRVGMNVATQINLKTAVAEGLGYVTAEAYNVNKAQVDANVAALVQGLTISLKGYALDAKYSEENLRKSNLAIRYHVRTFDFEISNGRNILVDYSFEEELPEFLMSLVTEATSLGQDHRGIDIIVKELMHVFDVTQLENDDPDFRERLDKIGFQYVASQLVRPVVYLNTIDLDNVDNVRSGDFMGDVRSYVEWELLNLVSLYYQNSYYKHQLRPGEKPVFKVFTSSVILENILSIPHYHNHLNTEESVDGSTIEYRRVLPNGTILDCVTCTFDYMRDRMYMIPYRENDPEDVLNWGHNWDFGTFIAHY